MRFFEHFAAGVGGIVMGLVTLALSLRVHLNLGWEGLLVVPAVALAYAAVRTALSKPDVDHVQVQQYIAYLQHELASRDAISAQPVEAR
jgi:hypothetical protein